MRLRKLAANVLCCFVPGKKLRHKIREAAYPFALAPEQRLALIKKHFPDLNIKRNREIRGAVNNVVVVNESHCFRFVYNREWGGHLGKLPMLVAVAAFMRVRLGLPAPNLEIVEDSRFVPYLKYKYFRGEFLCHFIRTPEWPKKRRRVARSMARLLQICSSVKRAELEGWFSSLPGGDKIAAMLFGALKDDPHCRYALWNYDPMNLIIDPDTCEITGLIDLDSMGWMPIRVSLGSLNQYAFFYPLVLEEYKRLTGIEIMPIPPIGVPVVFEL